MFDLMDLIRRGWLALSQVRGEMVWVMCGQLLTFVGGVLNIKLLTNLMSIEEYGALALGLSIAGVINLFVFGPLGQGVLRYVSIAKEKGVMRDYFVGVKALHFRATWVLLVFVGLLALFVPMLTQWHWILLFSLSILYGVASGINYSMTALQSAVRNRKVVAIHQAGLVWFGLLMAIMLMWLLGWSSEVAMMGMTLGAVMVNVSHWFFIRRDRSIGADWLSAGYLEAGKGLQKDIFIYSYSFVYFSAFAAISMYADRWILQTMYGQEAVGIYVALFLIASAPVTLLMGVVNQLMVPIIFQTAGSMSDSMQHHHSNKLLMKVFVAATMLCLPIVGIAWWLGDGIVRTLSSEAFVPEAGVLWMIVLGLCLFNLGQLLVVKGLNAGRPKLYILPKAMQAFSFLLFAYYFTMSFGIVGVAVSLVLSSIVYLLLVIRVNRRLETISA